MTSYVRKPALQLFKRQPSVTIELLSYKLFILQVVIYPENWRWTRLSSILRDVGVSLCLFVVASE